MAKAITPNPRSVNWLDVEGGSSIDVKLLTERKWWSQLFPVG